MFKLFKHLKPYWFYVLLVFVLIGAQCYLQLLLPDQMAEVVKLIGQDTSVVSKMLRLGGIALAYAAGAAVLGVAVGFFASRIGAAFGRDLRAKVFKKAEGFSLHEFDKLGTSSLITRNTNDITQVSNVTVMMMRMIISAPIMLVGGIVMAVSKDRSLTLVLAGTIPLLIILILIVGLKAMPLFTSMQKKLDKMTMNAREGITGVRVIRAFNNDKVQKERFKESSWDLAKTSIKVNRIMAVMMPAVSVIFYVTIITMYYVAALNAYSLAYLANLTAVMQYGMQILQAFMMLAMLFMFLPRASASAKRINEVLDTDYSIKDKTDGKLPEGPRGLVFKNVGFRFDGAEDPALSGISFSAKPGEMVALVGGTGSGKSTVINLLERFYDVTEGAIELDGVDIRDMPQDELRKRIGMVPQSVSLFSGSIRDNIAFGKPDATDEEVREAARIAQAADFIEKLEDGYDSYVAQNGTNFSGGQRQRLAIARAVVRKPEIFIFDDSFSALDYKTDAALRKALAKITKSSIVLIVAQRLSTVVNADKIIVLEHGQINGLGTHDQLLEESELYREIAHSQVQEVGA